MSAPGKAGPEYREPNALVRAFVYAFALAAPLLTLIAGVLPASILVRTGSESGAWMFAVFITAAYVALLAAGVRVSRRAAARFTPPLALPGDIWNIGVAHPSRRSRNWPIRLRRRAV